MFINLLPKVARIFRIVLERAGEYLGIGNIFAYFSRKYTRMEIRVDIAFDQLLATIKRLPASKLMQLKSELDNNKIEVKAERELSDFQDFLLTGPVMNEDQYQQFQKNRENFNKWRK